jgi:hypothetical protein
MMPDDNLQRTDQKWPTLAAFPWPAKALVTMIILTMAVALGGALGQIIVHDIIPTFFSDQTSDLVDQTAMTMQPAAQAGNQAASKRGDLFSEGPVQPEAAQKPPFYQNDQFVWTLKWTHIHLFGMNMIFIFTGVITLFLNISIRARTGLVILPFIGVLLDIAAIWLKGYISPAFFWLHIPGGGLFGIVFVIVSLRAFREMFGRRKMASRQNASGR